MDRPPIGSGACCPPSVSGITYLQVGNPGHTVGMLNLDTVFKQLYAMEKKTTPARCVKPMQPTMQNRRKIISKENGTWHEIPRAKLDQYDIKHHT